MSFWVELGLICNGSDGLVLLSSGMEGLVFWALRLLRRLGGFLCVICTVRFVRCVLHGAMRTVHWRAHTLRFCRLFFWMCLGDLGIFVEWEVARLVKHELCRVGWYWEVVGMDSMGW